MRKKHLSDYYGTAFLFTVYVIDKTLTWSNHAKDMAELIFGKIFW